MQVNWASPSYSLQRKSKHEFNPTIMLGCDLLEDGLIGDFAGDHFAMDGVDSGFYNTYEPREIIGRGMASTVRRCIEKVSGVHYAVKVVDISTERQTAKEARRLKEETLSEVQLLRLLSGHPSIILIRDFFATPTFLFAIFELAPCGELFDLLNKSVSFSEKRTRSIMRQLFEGRRLVASIASEHGCMVFMWSPLGVAFMHEKQIVHRDLKLENILCIDDRRIVISDFGFAKQLEANQKLRELFGTPGYLSPEILRCQMYEDAVGYAMEVDNWAMGVIMFTLLCGYAPFYHRSQLRMMRLIQEGKYEFSDAQWDSISEDAKELIRRLLTVEAEKRIRAIECLRSNWMRAAEGRGVAAEQPEAAEAEKAVKRDATELRRLFRIAQHSVRFVVRIRNMKQLKTEGVDLVALRKRPYRSREIRHEAEAVSFAVYGHWVNRGFYYSRDMLFANQPKPKYVKISSESPSAAANR